MSFDFSKLLDPLPQDLIDIFNKPLSKEVQTNVKEKQEKELFDFSKLEPLNIQPLIQEEKVDYQNQNIERFTDELLMSPLSPKIRSPVKSPKPPVKIHKVEKSEIHQCCICLDENVPTNKLLNCKHPVCETCVGQLHQAKCPVCRSQLEGEIVTSEVLMKIMQREEEERAKEQTANYLAGLYMQEHPFSDPEEVYDMYRNV